MKKSLIVFWGFIFLFVLGGCEVERGKEVVESGSGKNVVKEKKINDEEEIVVKKDRQIYNMTGGEVLEEEIDIEENVNPYLKWIVPIEKFNHLDASLVQKKDCIGFDLAWGINGGDLLSSLIADDEARSLMNLEVYTKEYVRNLEQKIVKKTHQEYDADFYASYVCHFSDNLDIIAGKLIPEGESEFIESGKFAGNIKTGNPVFIIVYNENIYTYQDIRFYGKTATGGEPPYCKGILENDVLTWSCFMGLHKDNNGDVDGSYLKNWKISLENGNVSVSENTSNFDNINLQKGMEIKDNIIYMYGEKRGWIENNRIFIDFENKIYSFEFDGNLDALSISYRFHNRVIFYYKGLKIQEQKDSTMKYQCGKSIVYDEKDPVDCETNGKDFLIQYEYKNTGPKIPSLERNYPMPWKQVFVKKIGNINVVFEGELKGVSAFNSLDLYVNHYKFLLRNGLIDDVHLTKEEEENLDLLKIKLKSKFSEMRDIVDSVEYLHALQNEPVNIENKKKWIEIVESFRVEDPSI